MNSNITNSSDSRGKEKVDDLASLTRKLYELKTQIKAERVDHVSEKVAKNKCKLEGVLYLADMLRTKEYSNMLSFRMNNPLAVLKPQQKFDLDSPDIPEEAFTIIKTENEEMANEDVTVPTRDQGLIKDLDKSFDDALDSFGCYLFADCVCSLPSCINKSSNIFQLQEYPERNRASFIGSEPGCLLSEKHASWTQDLHT
ncbi:hypothetical protein Tco_0031039 [Tanacetum coccineum]